jgi:hypothetical protein
MVARNTEWYYFQGKASWAKLITPDLEFKNWNIKVHLTPDSYNQFMKLKEPQGDIDGILNEVKQDDDGYFVVFKRPTEKKFGNEIKMFSPPEVLDADGNTMHNIMIGNGSDVTVKVECYKYNKPFKKGRGRAIRLVSVRVDNLITYERKKDFTEAQEHAVAGLEAQPKQLF